MSNMRSPFRNPKPEIFVWIFSNGSNERWSASRIVKHDSTLVTGLMSADMLTQEFCAEPEYTREGPIFWLTSKLDWSRTQKTVTNPFVLLVRYEYAFGPLFIVTRSFYCLDYWSLGITFETCFEDQRSWRWIGLQKFAVVSCHGPNIQKPTTSTSNRLNKQL